MKLPINVAAAVLRREAEYSETGPIDEQWKEYVEMLSRLCAEGGSSTHIAFLGTSILAKAVNLEVDLFAIKPTRAIENPNAYSARTLCHSVLVPLAAELGINIGVTSREPLNNQPYFRMAYLGDETPIHSGARLAFDYMVNLVRKLQAMECEEEALAALRAFIIVRRQYQPRYSTGSGLLTITPETLASRIETLVTNNSEHGSRAQAVVAGLLDVFAGEARVISGRINDPSRKYPGDVCIRTIEDDTWEKAVECRDKGVKTSDVHIFAKKCIQMGVREAAIVMVCPSQKKLDDDVLSKWAAQHALGLTLFYGWKAFVEQVLFWAATPKPIAVIIAVERIEARLIAVEASPEAVALWQALVRGL